MTETLEWKDNRLNTPKLGYGTHYVREISMHDGKETMVAWFHNGSKRESHHLCFCDVALGEKAVMDDYQERATAVLRAKEDE